MKRVHSCSGLLAPVFAVLLAAMSLTAQVSRIGGALQGSVTDSTGAVIPGAHIWLRNADSGRLRELVSDGEGQFRATELPAGTYQVRVESRGFAPYEHAGIAIALGQTVHVPVTLATAGVQQQVTVAAQPPALDPEQTTLTTNVDTESIEELPVVSRNYLNFVLLSPGVAPTSPAQSAAATQTDSGFTFGGLRTRSNNLSIDGTGNNDEYTGASRTELSLETIREFQVVNNGLSAEAGGASGGAINVVTKTGTNIFHGDSFLFVQNGALNAREPFAEEPGTPDLHRYRAGFALGGPIRKDRTFFYVAAEQEHARAETASDIGAASRDFINQKLLPLANSGTRQLASGFTPTAMMETEASGKLSHQLGNRHSLMLRYAFTNARDAGDAFNTVGLADASARGSSFTADNALVGSLASVLGQDKVNDLRFQLATRRVVLRTGNAPAGPEMQLAGIADFGRLWDGNSTRRENHYELTDTLALSRGHHLLKTGATVNRVHLRANVPDGFGGFYGFVSPFDFGQGSPEMFRQAFGDPRSSFAVNAFGGFAQDHWTLARRLTLDLGLRYDFEHLPAQFNQDTNNFSPRIGIAYSPADKWVLRAGYGIYFDRYILASLNQAVQNRYEQVLEGASGVSSVFQAGLGGPLMAPLASVKPSVYLAQPGMATPYSQQSSLGIERALSANMTASASYLFVRGVKLPRTLNVNLAPPSILGGGMAEEPWQTGGRSIFTGRLNPNFDNIYELQDTAASTYHGVSFTLNRRLANEVAFSASYTFSKTIDDASDFNEQPLNPYDLRAERALSTNDQRHRFVFSGLFDLPFGDEEEKGKSEGRKEGPLAAVLGNIEVAPILTLASGRPVNPLLGYDAERSGAWPLISRPLLTPEVAQSLGLQSGLMPRNSLRTPAFYNLDVRVLKYFSIKPHGKLDLVFELFNVFNHPNVAAINPFWGGGFRPIAGFGQPIEAVRPRQAQFSIDYEF